MIKIYTIYSSSHSVLFEKYFRPSVPDSNELVVVEHEQLCSTGDFYSQGWSDICYKKVKAFKSACEQNLGGYFIWSDVDIEFYNDEINELLLEELGDYDIACQNDFANSHCSGFFICKATDRTLKLFETMRNDYHVEDQTTLNKHIGMVKHKFLSKRFFNYGQSRGRVWDGENFEVEKEIVLFHANWTVGVNNKIKMLDYVKARVRRII